MNWARAISQRAHSLLSPTQSRPSYGWAVLFSSLVIWSLVVGMWYTFGVFFKPVASDFGWNRASTSLAVSIGMLTNGVLSPVAGILSDKYGPRLALLSGGLFSGLGYSLISQTQTLWHFYLFYVVVGIGMATSYIPVVSVVSRWFPHKRGFVLGLTGVGAGVGQTIMPPLASYLVYSLGWRLSYILLGVPIGVLMAGLALVLRTPPSGATPDFKNGTAAAASFSLRRAMSTPALWILLGILSLAAFNLQTVMMHLVNYATDPGRSLSPTLAASFLAVIGIANIIGKLGLGALSDRMGRRVALTISFALGALALLWLNLATSPWMFYIFAAIFGFSYGGWVPVFPALAGDLYGMASLGAILGVIQVGGPIGSATGTYLAGQIFDTTQSYQAAFLLAAAFFVLGCILVQIVRRPQAG